MHRSIHAQHDRFVLNRPFRIARGVKTVADVITVTLRQGSAVGQGEGVPYPRYGESIDDALGAIEAVRSAIEGGASREELLALLPAGAARNAVDCAMWDLESRLSGRSVFAMLGTIAPSRMASALTIVIDTPDMMAKAAALVADAPLLKIKVDAEDPAGRLRAVRAAAPNCTLIVDPNEGWDRVLLEAMQPVLIEVGVPLLEQPVPADDDAWLESFVSAVPICADESFHSAVDLPSIARRYQAVNIKLDKAGGLTAAVEIAREARAHGLMLMTGCMVCSSLSIAPALNIAGLSDFVDLDGPFWLSEDRDGGVSNENGLLLPPKAGFWGTI